MLPQIELAVIFGDTYGLLALSFSSPWLQRSCLDRAGLWRPCWAVERAKKGLLQKRRATLNGELRNFTIPRETKTKPFGKNISGSVTQGMSMSEETNIEKETCFCKSQTSGFSIHCSLPEVVKTKEHIYMTPGMKRRRQRFTHKQ